MTKPSKEVEKIEQLLADPWAVDIEELWQQAAHTEAHYQHFKTVL